jgi:putative membrane protein
MGIVAQLLIGLIAFLHIYILWFEMFAWEKRGPKVFKNFPKELFPQTTALAANQGLYNGFLAAGLIWSLLIENQEWNQNVAIFFLSCVAVAGIYGFFTADKKIIFVQTIPSVIVILILLLG